MGLNKETVAVIHYMDGAWEREAKVYSLNAMLQMIQHCDKKGFVYWVCLTQLDTIIPMTSHKPVTATLTAGEYVDKVEVSKQPQKPFKEVTRIEQIHHPPTQLDHQAHAERVRKIYRDVQGY